MKNIFKVYGVILVFCLPVSAFAQSTDEPIIETEKDEIDKTESILDVKTDSVTDAINNPFSISQHRRNYFLPATYATNPNTVTIDGLNDSNVDNFEAKYQISVKLPLYIESDSSSGLYLGFTLKSFWQIYNSEVSKPFRETNYEPEVYYSWQNELSILGFKFNNIQAGINHQSNGQTNVLSRSWNRLFASALFSDDTSFYYIKTWYRLPEDEKETPTSATGDDNPDISKYLGHVEVGYGTTWGKTNISGLIRNNLRTSDNKGSFELNVTYPLTKNYDFLFQYFNGYGDSLIDYNRHQQRVGLGVQLKFL